MGASSLSRLPPFSSLCSFTVSIPSSFSLHWQKIFPKSFMTGELSSTLKSPFSLSSTHSLRSSTGMVFKRAWNCEENFYLTGILEIPALSCQTLNSSAYPPLWKPGAIPTERKPYCFCLWRCLALVPYCQYHLALTHSSVALISTRDT